MELEMKTRYKIIIIGVITSIIFVLDIMDFFLCWESKILEIFACWDD